MIQNNERLFWFDFALNYNPNMLYNIKKNRAKPWEEEISNFGKIWIKIQDHYIFGFFLILMT